MHKLINPLQLYFKQLSKIPEISPKEFKFLYKLIKNGDNNAKTRLVEGNLKLVITIASKYKNKGLSFMDLIEEGNMGLIKAIDHYKVRKDSTFSTYASWWIKQGIRRAIDNQAKTIRIPSYALEHIKALAKKWKELGRDKRGMPKIVDISYHLKITQREAKNLVHAIEVLKGETSFDKFITEDENITMKDIISDKHLDSTPEGFLDIIKNNEDVQELLESLNPKEKLIITERFGLKGNKIKTLKILGQELSISRERVRQIEENAIKKMQKLAQRKNIF
ncbi:RNA polymerase sigma factor RpoD/SigA [bacterium]